jgi:hypothetical protein
MALMNPFLGDFLCLPVQHFLYSPYCGIMAYDSMKSGKLLPMFFWNDGTHIPPRDYYTNIHCHKNCKISSQCLLI